MKKLNNKIFLLNDDVCPICGTKIKDIMFKYSMFHGRARASCCGATYQLSDYYIKNPDEKKRQELELLRNGYIRLEIDSKWIYPLKKAIEITKIKDIDNPNVYKIAKEIMENK